MARTWHLVTMATIGCVLVSCSLLSDSVAITSADLDAPGQVSLGVASCNGAPDAAVVDAGDGRYEVEVRTTQQWERGNDCADLVQIAVDPDLERLEIFDVVSGDSFTLPRVDIVVNVPDIDGFWQMVEVNGAAVEIDVNTIEIPAIEIRAGVLSGRFGCNGGEGELLYDGQMLLMVGQESTAELCGIPDGSEVMVPTERVLRSLLEAGAQVERNGDQMTWERGEDRLVFKLIEQ